MDKKGRNYIPELLLPAGGKKQLIAAVENGADAIYLGGSQFNARINAENFSEIELEEALRYAHSKDVKLYITLNTLLFNNELVQALQYAKLLYKIGVDALIVQDFGFAKLLKENLPDFELHLSTQASIYNLEGAKMAKKLGFSRVVTARENTIEEIKYISQNSDIELEIFVHGAMCICYSGQCHLSREIGGRSGNRGVCAQPCRMKYDAKGSSEYFLSPKDLSTIHYLKEISQAKVSSLKIEGRMKSPEYVAVVCQIYRKYLDKYAQYGEYSVSQEDERNLAQIFNRGNFSSAYYFGRNDKGFMAAKMPKHQGIYIGRALSKFSDTLVDVKLENGESLQIGDGVEFRNSELSGNVISYCKKNKDGSFRIGDIKGRVAKGDELYKISDKRQLEEIRLNINMAENGKGLRKSPVDMYLEIKEGEFPILEIVSGAYRANAVGRVLAQRALKVAITEEKAESQMKKLGDTPFESANIFCQIQAGVSIPISALNEMRREAVKKLVLRKQGVRECKDIEITIKPENMENFGYDKGLLEIYFHKFYAKEKAGCLEIINRLFDDKNSDYRAVSLILPVYDILENAQEIEEFKLYIRKNTHIDVDVVPYIFPISKGKMDEYLKVNEQAVVDLAKIKGIYVGNLGSVNFLQNKDVKLFGDYGLNITNSEAVKFAKKLNLQKICLSHEINQRVCGKIPLMISEHIFDEDVISDRKQKKYEICYISRIEKSIIYAKKDIAEILKEVQGKNQLRVYL